MFKPYIQVTDACAELVCGIVDAIGTERPASQCPDAPRARQERFPPLAPLLKASASPQSDWVRSPARHSSDFKITGERRFQSLLVVCGHGDFSFDLLQPVQGEVVVHRLSKSGMGSFDALVTVGGRKDLHVFLLRGVQKAAPNLGQNRVVQAVLHLVDEEDLFTGSDQLRID